MKSIVCIAFLLFSANAMGAQTPAKPSEFDINTAERFANLALACVHKEYPNKLSHTLNGDADVAPPRKLTPAFYGCYDWHSSVHGHWLPKLSHPVRIGEHYQTAFALSFMLDYARTAGDAKFAYLVVSKARQFYLGDQTCPLAYEPSGEDFLSPCLGETDLMRRVLPNNDFAGWLQAFLPQISSARRGNWLRPVVSPDPSDPKLAHLDGLNLSRAWMLEGIAAGLPKGDKRLPMIRAAAEEHKNAGLAAVTGKHYEGGHWLGSFAVYLVTRRGISQK